MSIRTIIEINHDYLHDLTDEKWEELKRYLRSGGGPASPDRHLVPGIRVLGQRHHSEELKLTII